jgi:glucose 1-dehydrogenase
VTGSSRGLGAAIAIALAEAGAKVAVHGSTTAPAATQKRVAKIGHDTIALVGDVGDAQVCARLVEETVQHFGTIDILVNNAGLQRDAAFASMTLEQWNTVIAINLTGQFLCARAAIAEFLRRGVVPAVSSAAGKIICMSSVHQQIPWAGHANYAASKGGVKLLMESLAQEVAPHRIRVNAIAPGAIRTPINTDAWGTPAAYAALMTLVPYGRIGEPEDIARAAVWLASDQSDYVVGTTLFVDGGMTLYPGFATGG